MLHLSSIFSSLYIISLQHSKRIAKVLYPLLDPTNLTVVGLVVESYVGKNNPKIVLTQDIRDYIPKGVLVNDVDAITEPGELIKYRDIMRVNYQLVGKKVINQGGRTIGTCTDFATKIPELIVTKIYYQPVSLLKLNPKELVFDRSNIIELTDKKILTNLGKPNKAKLGRSLNTEAA